MSERTDVFMRGSDAFSWYLEKDPGLRSTILAIAWLNRTPDFEALATRLDWATWQAPRFRQRPLEPPARLANPRWVDTDFDLSLHLRRMESPSPHTPAAVIDFARVEAMTGFDRSRPLWKFTLIERLDGDHAALVMKVHHSLTDGIGGMQLAFLLFDMTEEPAPGGQGPATGSDGDVPRPAELVREAIAHNCRQAVETVRHALSGTLPAAIQAARNPLHSVSDAMATVGSLAQFVRPVSDTLSPVMTGRSLQRSLDMVGSGAPRPQTVGEIRRGHGQRRLCGLGHRRPEALPRVPRGPGGRSASHLADLRAQGG
jgi:diacylglycerol O-acyltransferase / wax synthase